MGRGGGEAVDRCPLPEGPDAHASGLLPGGGAQVAGAGVLPPFMGWRG